MIGGGVKFGNGGKWYHSTVFYVLYVHNLTVLTHPQISSRILRPWCHLCKGRTAVISDLPESVSG